MNAHTSTPTQSCYSLIILLLLLGSIGLIHAEAARLNELPQALQYTASEAIGRNQRAYHAEAAPDGFRAATPAQNYTTHFDAQGMALTTGQSQLTLRLTGLGYGDRLIALEPAQPTAQNNRIEYRHGAMTEWYVNGPLGLQQGFTLAERPEPGFLMLTGLADEPLTLALSISSDWQTIISADGRSLNLAGDGASLRYGDLVVVDADGAEQPARFNRDPNSNNVQILIDDSAARYPLTVDPFFQQAYLKASNAEASDWFGFSVAISGDYALVGAYYEDGSYTSTMANPNEDAENAGAAYVFVRSGDAWSQQAYLKASNAETGDFFGYSVAISGDYALVGAFSEDGNASSTVASPNDSTSGAGAAYVFVRSGAVWSQQAYLKASNAGVEDIFGFSAAISGDYALVGAYYEDGDSLSTMASPNNNAAEAGAAYVFVRSGAVWSQQAYLKASNAGVGDLFGCSVAISGDYALVSSSYEDGNASSTMANPNNDASGAGAAYVFVRSGDAWSQQAYLKASNAEVADRFGYSVAISGDYAVVGAHYEDGDSLSTMANPNNDASGAGAAYVFKRNDTVWSQQAYLKASNAGVNDNFGKSAAISGDYAVVGAYFEDGDSLSTMANPNNDALGAGAAYVFVRSGDAWSQQAYLKASNAGVSDFFGCSVAISGDYAVVGAQREAGDASSTMASPNNDALTAGAAYVHKIGAVIQAITVASTAAGSGSANLSWTRGNGDGCAVFMCEGTAGTAAPVDNVTYTANPAFGSGTQIGLTGWYCVYDGAGTSVTVTGLTPSADYRVHVCEYLLGSIHYNTAESTGNPFNFEAPIVVQLSSFAAATEGSAVRLIWTTASETGVAGYNVLSGFEQDGAYKRLNGSLIAALGSAARGSSYSYLDAAELKDPRWYKLEIINLDGSRETSAPISVTRATLVGQDPAPTEFALHQNYPNPFNPTTTIAFALPAESEVSLVIYDAQSRVVRTLVNGNISAGVHKVIWDGRNDSGFAVPSGLYFCRIKAGEFSEIRKLTFLK